MECTFELNSESDKCNDLYELIKRIVYSAPEKYDDVIKNRSKIQNTVAFGIGLIPGTILTTLLLLVPEIRNVMSHTYIVYPLVALFLSWLLGGFVGSGMLSKWYAPIVPNKKYAGHDSDYNSIYKDDLESFTRSAEILIGKKINNLEYREKIKETYDKYKVLIKKELIVLAIISCVLILAGIIVK